MKRHHSLSPGTTSRLLFAILTCATAIACGPKAAPATTDAATTSTSTSDPNTTTTGTSASTTGGPSTSTTADPSTPTTACSTSDCSGSSTVACTFLNCPDDSPHGDDCDVFAQDCPEGQKCAAFDPEGCCSWNSAHCVDVTGDGQPGDSCVYDGIAIGSDSCAKGSMCWDTDENNVGTCVQQCTGDAETPVCPDGPCSIAADGALILCLTDCDPLLQDCPGTQLCIPNGDKFVCVLDAGGDEGQANDPCEFANVCDPGLVCLDPATGGAGCDPAAGGCCSPFCEFPNGPCPNPDQVCVQWFDPMQLPAGDPQLDIGVCAVPQ